MIAYDKFDKSNKSPVLGGIEALQELSPTELMQKMDRLVLFSGMATLLREFPLSILSDDERAFFAQVQSFFIDLEARSFDEIGLR